MHHDGKLFRSRDIFRTHAVRINQYLREWGAVGFRSAFMLHNLDWLCDLNVLYDASSFDTDPFEPQPDGVNTIFPFWVDRGAGSGYVIGSSAVPAAISLVDARSPRKFTVAENRS